MVLFDPPMSVFDAAADIGSRDEHDTRELHYIAATGTCQGVAVKGLAEHLAPSDSRGSGLCGLPEELPRGGDLCAADAIGEEPGVTENAEVLVGDVHDQPGDKFLDGQFQRRIFAGRAILVAEGHGLAVKGGDPGLGDNRSFAVTPDVADGEVGIFQRLADVDVPFFFVELGEIRVEGFIGADVFVGGGRFEFSGLEKFFEFQEKVVAVDGLEALVGNEVIFEPAAFIE